MYQTTAHFETIESLNQTEFNAAEEAALPTVGSSTFPSNFLAEHAHAFYEAACERIKEETLSPLCEAMIANRCNKPVSHNYTQFYHELLKNQRDAVLNFVEVGIGTPNQEVPSSMGPNYSFGASLRGWRSYFRNLEMTVRGGDVDPRVLFREDRIENFYINQLNPTAIRNFLLTSGLDCSGLDFVLDDGLHKMESNISLLLSVWPYMKTNSLYLIEDMSPAIFERNIELIRYLALGAVGAALALPSKAKDDNRVIVLQKL